MESFWIQRNIENRTLPQYFSILSLDTLSVTTIEDLTAGGLTIEANKGGTLTLQNLVAGITMNSSGNIVIDSALGGLTLESNNTMNISSILDGINIQSATNLALTSATSITLTAPNINFVTPLLDLPIIRLSPSAAPVLTNNSCALWYPNAPDERPKISIYTTLQTDYNLVTETPSVGVYNMTVTYGGATSTTNVRYYKMGRTTILTSDGLNIALAVAVPIASFTLSANIPKPVNGVTQTIAVLSGGTYTSGRVSILATGFGTIQINTPITTPPYPASPQFTAGACGFLPFTIIYETNY